MEEASAPFAMEEDRLQTEFRVRTTVVRTYVIIAMVCALIALISLCYSVWSWYFAYSNYGPAAVWRWSELPLYIGLVFVVIALLAAILWLRSRSLVVRATEEALIVLRGSRHKHTPWGEIESITTVSERSWAPFGSGRERFQFWIRQYTGKKQRFGSAIADVQRLAATIKLQIYPLLLDKYRHQLAGNETIDLGAVLISRSGIEIKRKEIGWQELSSAELESGKLVVHYQNAGRGMKVAIPSRKVKNMDLCIQLIEEIETQ